MAKADKEPGVLPDDIQQALVDGHLAELDDGKRLEFYKSVCMALELEWTTKPFAFIQLGKELSLYALKCCTDQLREGRGISLVITGAKTFQGLHVARVRATTLSGRTDESLGAVPVFDYQGNELHGNDLANAMMWAETKAKRRVTLAICGLGILDESEVRAIQGYEGMVRAVPGVPDAPKDQGAGREPEPATDIQGKLDEIQVMCSKCETEDELDITWKEVLETYNLKADSPAAHQKTWLMFQKKRKQLKGDN